MMKTCIACGMPMTEDKHYPGGDRSLDYCIHCARPDGAMHSWEEKLEGATAFLVKTQGLDPAVAREAARRMLQKLPAWKDREAHA